MFDMSGPAKAKQTEELCKADQTGAGRTWDRKEVTLKDAKTKELAVVVGLLLPNLDDDHVDNPDKKTDPGEPIQRDQT